MTIVAAWIRAETGVGPSIASGSHVWNGSCADFANAPTSSRIRPAVSSPWALWPISLACSKVARKSSVPEFLRMKNVPSVSPMSPTTLMTNALMPAEVAVVRRYQKEISR